MRRAIAGFHQDGEGHWVARLSCGHTQHVRHDPPFVSRPWVLRSEGRQSRLGLELNCLHCHRNGELEHFLADLERVPWFERLGEPVEADVHRIHFWEEWPGPETTSVDGMAQRQQALYDDLMAFAGDPAPEAQQLWERIHAIVFRDAAPRVPYDPAQDAWHPPSAAVWWAAWTAGLMGVCILLGRAVPPYLEEQWRWFCAGHWPCACLDGKLVIL